MRFLVATMLLPTCLCIGAANAADGCGPGCHSTVNGACVVNGWETGAVKWNECPAGDHPRPPCPANYVWLKQANTCFHLN
jgi:hypothetical protein